MSLLATPAKPRRPWGRTPVFLLALVALVAGTLYLPTVAQAATVYEISGQWASGTPAQVTTGSPVTAEWRISINDDAAAPTNEPVDNVNFTVVATSGTFAGIPDVCLTSGVSPVSSLSADEKTLTCNLGTKDQGTSVVVSTPITASGATGDALDASASIGGQTADLDAIAIANPFGMDIVWEGNSNRRIINSTSRDLAFQWTLFHNRGAAAGPNSITYTLTVTNTRNAGASVVSVPGCEPFDLGAADGHPWSSTTRPADQRAPFPTTCTLTRTSGAGTGTATFQLTISGIDYSQTQVPTKDSNGGLLPTDRVAVASGEIMIRILATDTTGTVTVTSNAPTYVPPGGGTSVQDDPSNNTSTSTWTTGTYFGGWDYAFVGSEGAAWSDTLRVPAGTVVRSFGDYVYPNSSTAWTYGAQCVTLDTRYVDFVGAGTTVGGRTPGTIAGATYYYYTGTSPLLDPSSASYNPNSFQCGASSTGWTSTLPTDLTTVKAVMVSFPLTAALRTQRLGLYADMRIKTTTPIGTDVWTWTGYSNTTGGSAERPRPGVGTWSYPNRSTAAADWNGVGSLTPGARYPFATGARDILRTIGTRPTLEKSASPVSIQPGETSTYTLAYSAQGVASVTPTVDDYQIRDTLPVGMTYVTGSASPAPVVTTVSGQQVLTWTLDDVSVNVDHTLTYQARADTSLAPGTALTNSATATVDGQSNTPAASATVRITDNGFTQLAKASDQAYIPNVNGDGNGAASWTVSVSSSDPTAQTFTDTIDILPYNGDGRGTSFSGSYLLSGPVSAPSGSTVYYTTTAPGSIDPDPAASSNGAAGSISGNTVGWTTTYTPSATAVRVIGGALAPQATFSFTIPYVTAGMAARDTLVNRADSRAQHTRLRMRTSGLVRVATKYSASLKKYVSDPDNPGQWLDANDPASFARYKVGDTVSYRVTVENTGETELENITVTDDLEPTLGGFTIAELASGATESHEYDVTLTADHDPQVINTACASAPEPDDASGPVEINCDPAGITIVNHPDVIVAKSSTPASGSDVEPGQVITYRIEFENTGDAPAAVDYTDHLTAVLDDADFVTGSITGTGGVDGAFDAGSGTIRMTGMIPVGQTGAVEYQVRVKETGFGDAQLLNVVRPDGETPPTTCESDDPLCTTHAVPAQLEVQKSVDPASGTTVSPGDELTYTLTFSNNGGADAAVDYTDYLAGVLDDADVVAGPEVVGGATAVTASPIAGDQFTVTGDLPGGQSVQVTYTVQVKAFEDRGDSILGNFVVEGDDEPPTSCEPGDELCTENPVGELVVAKSVDNASTDPIEVGDELTYQIRFENRGAVDMPVDYTDLLSDVIDDADMTAGPSFVGGNAFGLSLTPLPFTGDELNITGDLQAGQTAIVTYTMQVRAAADRGNSVMKNFVVEGDDEPPSVCQITDPLCTQNPVPEFQVSKTVDPVSGSTVAPGDELTYTVEFANLGGTNVEVNYTDYLTGVLDDAELVSAPAFVGGDGGLTLFAPTAQAFAVFGELPAGTTVVVQYTVEVKAAADRGDSVLGNFLVEGDDEPPTTCEPGSELCTENPVAEFAVSKSVTPESGTAVAPGDTLTYQLTFDNLGGITTPVDYTDYLAGILDDADLTSGPAFVGGDDFGLSLSPDPFSGDELSITGDLAAGETAVVEYTVTVKAAADRGDSVLGNFLVEGDDEPPTTCEPGDELCTENPVAEFTVSKSVTPASGTTVAPGDELTYELTFQNLGGLDTPVDYTDYVAGILDDADLTAGPAFVGGDGFGLSLSPDPFSGDELSITGDLAAGETAVVEYTVTVKDTDRGDSILGNFLVEGDDEPPTTCEPGNELCTENPVAEFTVSKSVTPASGSAVAPGDELTYELTFQNLGGLDTPVDYTDYLAGILDDADLTSGPAFVDGNGFGLSLAPDPFTGSEVSIVGDLAAGQTAVVTYSAQVRAAADRGDSVLGNFLVEGDNPPPTTCEPGSELCTENPVAEFTVSKSVTPESGTTVAPGDTLTYQLTFDNLGGLDTPVDYTDYLAGILDDADLTAGPAFVDGDDFGLSLSPDPFSGDELSITGDLAASSTATVEYTVTVKDTGRGDSVLGNFLVEGDDEPPTSCEPGSELCTENPVAEFTVSKSVDPDSGTTVATADELTYTLEFANLGGASTEVEYTDYLAGILDDAEIVTPPAFDGADGGLSLFSLTPQAFTVFGDLTANTTVRVTYTVRVLPADDRGDSVLGNFLVEGDDEPPTTCEPGNELCTENPVGELEVEKSVNRTGTEPLEVGEELVYEIRFQNRGAVDMPVDYTDHLAGILDDADLVSAPQFVGGNGFGLSLSPDPFGGSDQLFIDGSLQAGQTAVVTYTAAVRATADRNDSVMMNFVVEGDDPPPTVCTPGDPLCTVSPFPEFNVTKSVDPASGTSVVPGQELTYTITFANTGGTPAAVDYTDHLSGVLDDAEIVSGPDFVGADGGLSVSPVADEAFSVTGTLPANTTVQVQYTVEVKDAADRGDSILGNFVVQGDQEPPASCEPENPLCTQNPVSEIEVRKSVDPASGSVVTPDSELTYSLTFENLGGTAFAVDYTDYLAGILDDAEFTSAPSFADGEGHGLALAPSPFDGDELSITGDLAAGQTTVVTYSVVVKAAADRGDSVLGNFLVEGDQEPPTSCEPGDELCTENPVRDVVVAKSVTPESGTAVASGEDLTYRLTFQNRGGIDTAIDYTDYLAGVLDDAELSDDPAFVDGANFGLSLSPDPFSGDELSITGDLTAGETAVVEYTVTVKDAADRGDSVLGNFLVPGDEEPPTTCEPDSPFCTENPVRELRVSKSVDPESGSVVERGDSLTYRLTFENLGGTTAPVDHTDHLADVLDDADLTAGPAFVDDANFGLSLSPDPFSGDQLSITGDLTAGETAVVEYTVTVKDTGRGDSVLGNFLVEGDQEPPTTCEPGDELCTENPISAFDVTKSVDPASGTVVATGDELTYTLEFANTGGASAEVDFTDYLGGVLDDATLVSGPAFDGADGSLAVTEVADGQFSVTGTLAGNTTVRVTYTVEVLPTDERGDHVLGNFLVEGDEEPPTECDADNRFCTENPVGELVVEKSVDPASGTAVDPGDELTYTLRFENRGGIEATVDYTDHLAGVLDDATIVTAPAIAGESHGLSVSGVSNSRFSVSGELEVGATVEVTYTVKVKTSGRGDSMLGNFLVRTGEEPPADCSSPIRPAAAVDAVEGAMCTQNPIGDLAVSKSADPESGSEVVPGDEVTYTLEFRNLGATAQPVDYTDHLAGVLDDATVVADPAIAGSAHGLSVSSITDDTFTVSGDLAAGATVRVTYTVEVNGDGDSMLGNFLVNGDGEPPTVCEPSSVLCTEHPIGAGDVDDSTDDDDPGLDDELADTGGPALVILLGGLVLVAAGAGLLVARRRRED